MKLIYEDESGNVSETTKELKLEVTEAEKDLAAAVSTEEETGAGFPVIPVLAAAAILAAAVMGILLIRRKKNRTMDEEEALLDELERSSEDEP